MGRTQIVSGRHASLSDGLVKSPFIYKPRQQAQRLIAIDNQTVIDKRTQSPAVNWRTRDKELRRQVVLKLHLSNQGTSYLFGIGERHTIDLWLNISTFSGETFAQRSASKRNQLHLAKIKSIAQEYRHIHIPISIGSAHRDDLILQLLSPFKILQACLQLPTVKTKPITQIEIPAAGLALTNFAFSPELLQLRCGVQRITCRHLKTRENATHTKLQSNLMLNAFFSCGQFILYDGQG